MFFSVWLLHAEELLWHCDGSNLQVAEKQSPGHWFNKNIKMSALPDASFKLGSHAARRCMFDPQYPWLEIQVLGAEKLELEKRYYSWGLHLDKLRLLGNVRDAHPGIYCVKLPQLEGDKLLKFYIYNMFVNFKHIKMLKKPSNFIELIGPEGVDALRKGDKINILVSLEQPCEDLSCQLFTDIGRGLSPFSLNKTNAVELKKADDGGRLWRAELLLDRFEPAKEYAVAVKVSVLGGQLGTPLWGKVPLAFVAD